MGNDAEFKEMVKFIEKYNISPMICRRYPFEQFTNAIKQMGDKSLPGKTVVVF
jgi:D-arabinose 1-dehydrogenase-like Zn-dependent alcohol dehydrogenase